MVKFKIGAKIALGFGLIILNIAALVAVIAYNVEMVDENLDNLNDIQIPVLELANDYDTKTLEILVLRSNFLIDNKDTESLNAALALFDPMLNEMLSKGRELQKIVVGPIAEVYNRMMNGLADRIGSWKIILGNVVQAVNDRTATVKRLDEASLKFLEAGLGYEDVVDQNLQEQLASGNRAEQERALQQTIILRDLMFKFSDIESNVYRGQYMNDPEMLRQNSKTFDSIDMFINNLRPLTRVPANFDRLKQMQTLAGEYRTLLLDTAKTIEKTNQLIKECRAASTSLRAIFDETAKTSFVRMHARSTSAGHATTITKWVLMVSLCLSLLLSLIVAVIITRTVVRPVRATSNALNAVADGDFTVSIPAEMLKRGDEMGEMLGSVRKMCDNLSNTVSSVMEEANTVANAAVEISQGNQHLSEQTQQQAGAIEETASALEQMTSSVKNNAESAAQANNLARTTSQMAEEGGEVLTRTVQAMKEVTESSKKISDIINVVNEIAFQTNLLALNAAVEAARAGEAGKGFAVVAGEVRNLAGRSADAAKEIQALISDSVAKVEQGNHLVAESGDILGKIIVNVRNVADTIGEITSASQEQAAGIEEVSKAVNQMDQAVQQNAAFVEEAASSSESMSNSANAMRQRMSAFKVREGQIITRSLPAPAAMHKPAAPTNKPPAPKVAAKAIAPKAVVPKPAAPKPAAHAAANQAKPAKAQEDDFFGVSDMDGFEEF